MIYPTINHHEYLSFWFSHVPVCKRQIIDAANDWVSQIRKITLLDNLLFLSSWSQIRNWRTWEQSYTQKCSLRHVMAKKKKTRRVRESYKIFGLLKSKEVLSFNWLHINPEIQILKFYISMKRQIQNHLSVSLTTDRGLAVCSEWTQSFLFGIYPLLRFYFGIYMWGIWTWIL